MAIFNLTPDSFIDAGKFQSVEAAVSQVRSMISDGADIIDLGAQSTRPMASSISVEEELDLSPSKKLLRRCPRLKGNFYLWILFIQRLLQKQSAKGLISTSRVRWTIRF